MLETTSASSVAGNPSGGGDTPPVEGIGTGSRPPSPQLKIALCPYCGHESLNLQQCDSCKGYFEPLSKQATQNAMGPWFLRDIASPFRPGFSYETLRSMIAKGRISREAALRGPSTRQFWMRAASTPGVAHLLGECHACHQRVSPADIACPSCAASFVHTPDRQYLGLAPVHLLPGHADPELIAARMLSGSGTQTPGPRSPARSARANRAAPAVSPASASPVPVSPSPTIQKSADVLEKGTDFPGPTGMNLQAPTYEVLNRRRRSKLVPVLLVLLTFSLMAALTTFLLRPALFDRIVTTIRSQFHAPVP